MITVDDPRMKAAIERAQANGTTIGSADAFAAMDAATIVNVEENVWEQDDVFELPKTREEALPFVCVDVYKNLPRKADGTYPVGYSILVDVKNSRTGAQSIKRFRPNQPCNNIPAYKWDEAQNAYVSTGETFGPKNAIAQAVKMLGNQGARLDYFLGKKVKVSRLIAGDQAVRKGGIVVGIARKNLPEFEIVTE